jgi:hypothetical protein
VKKRGLSQLKNETFASKTRGKHHKKKYEGEKEDDKGGGGGGEDDGEKGRLGRVVENVVISAFIYLICQCYVHNSVCC